MVRSLKRSIVLASAFACLTLATAAHADTSAVGVWKLIDPDTKKVGGLIQVLETKNHSFEGYIIKMYAKPGDPVDPVCSSCSDDRKDKPVLGIRLIQNLKRDGAGYEGGTILDPRNGTEYNAKMSVSDDGNTLTVRGFLGLSVLGQSQEWERLPADEVAKLDTDKDARYRKPGDVTAKKKKNKKKGGAQVAAPADAPPAEAK